MHPEKNQAAYDEILAELKYHFQKSANPVARMATVVALLQAKLKHVFWTGFYVLIDGELTVGPYQGPPACITLPPHHGVCWAGIDRGESVVVPNVRDFPGHIVCDGRANSEIVVPLRDKGGRIVGVLDIDSADFDAFSKLDVERLEQLLRMIHN